VTNLATTVCGTSLGLVDPVVVPFLSDSPDVVRVLEARVADTDDGSCRACFTASISSDSGVLRRGIGEFNLGGRGGGGDTVAIELPWKPGRRGGGGRGPAVE